MHRRRLLLSLGAAAAALAAGLAGIREFDAFHHLAMGRHLATHGLFGPEPFLYTLGGQPALPPPHWLGSLAIHAAHALSGLAGVVLLSGLVAAAAIGLATDDALRPERPRAVRTRTGVVTVPDGAGEAPGGWRADLAALVPVALAIGAWRLRAVPSPDVLGLLAFAWTLHALRHGGRWRLWSLPAVALAWACLDPSIVFGVLALGLALLDALRDVVVAPRDAGGAAARARARSLGLVLLASTALAAAAPGGALGLAVGSARVLLVGGPAEPGSLVARARILEQQPVAPELLLTPAGLLLLLVPLGWLLAWRRPRLGDSLLLLALVVAASRSIRFVPWVAVAAAPLLARDLATAVRRLLGRAGAPPAPAAAEDGASAGAPARTAGLARLRPALGGGLAAALSASLAGALWWSATWLPPAISLGVAEDLFPVRAADVLAGALPRAPQARLWNALPAGGYLEWRLEGRQVYQDGRLAWPPGEAEAALAGPADRTRFAALDERWRFDALVTDYPPLLAGPESGQALDPAADRGRWALVAFDDGGLLYVRRDGALAELAAREYREAAPAGALPPARLLDPGRRDVLEAEYRRALAERPACAVCRAGLWLALASLGEAGAREAEALLPGGRLPETSNPFGHPGLEAVAATAWATARTQCERGVVLQAARRWKDAADAYRTCVRLAPTNAWAGEALSRAEDLSPTRR